MITEIQSYFLGLMYSKGDILVDGDCVKFKINIKFRRPDDEALRSDNVYTAKVSRSGGKEKLGSRFANDFFLLKQMLSSEFGIGFDLLLDDAVGSSWNKKIITIVSDNVKNNDKKFTSLFVVDKIDSTTLHKFPFSLKLDESKPLSLSFIQGVCDACSLVPNEASSQNGGEGSPRIQLEPNQDRWELCIGLCMAFQLGLGIRVNNINWGHPQIRTKWRGQNHQFRVSLSDIPNNIELYRLEYKREEYHNLYKRCGVAYEPLGKLCPELKKGLKKGTIICLPSSTSPDLNNSLLHDNLNGISIDVPGKKSIIVCYLLGCKRCRDYISVSVDGKKK